MKTVSLIRSSPWLLVLANCLLFAATAQAVDFARLYADLNPSVVTIRTLKLDSSTGRVVPSASVGSGFFLESDLVMTAAHVVNDVDLIAVHTSEGRRFKASVVSVVDSSDVALLRLDEDFPDAVTVSLGDPEAALVGSPVFVIGAPFGLEHTLSVGHLSGKSTRSVMVGGSPALLLQTDTAINPGNSGGPMFNEQGEVIGVVSFILTKNGGSNGIGFASSITNAYEGLMNSSGFWAGFEGIVLTDTLAAALNVPSTGILVQRVVKGSAAEKSGLVAGQLAATIGDQKMQLGGDVILTINGLVCAEPHDFRQLSEAARQARSDLGYEMTVFRDGKKVTLLAAGYGEFRPLR